MALRNGLSECGDLSPLFLAATRRGESSTADKSADGKAGASSRTPKIAAGIPGSPKGGPVKKNKSLRLLVVMCIFVFISTCPGLNAASNVLWQIGKFDESSVEFSQGPLFSVHYPEAPVVYVVGKSNPEKDWPAFQPGTANGGAGFHPYPFTVQFELPDAPKGRLYPQGGAAWSRRRECRDFAWESTDTQDFFINTPS